jgi:hypothetical protein
MACRSSPCVILNLSNCRIAPIIYIAVFLPTLFKFTYYKQLWPLQGGDEKFFNGNGVPRHTPQKITIPAFL